MLNKEHVALGRWRKTVWAATVLAFSAAQIAIANPKPSSVAAKVNGAWGILSLSGKWTIPPTLSSATYVDDEGYYFVTDRQGLQGLVDASGRWILKPMYAAVILPGSNGLIGARTNDCWGFVDASGQWKIPAQFDAVEKFDVRGHAEVRSGFKYGTIDQQGRWVIPPKFDFISNFSTGGFALAREQRGGASILVNRAGERVGNEQFQEGYFFSPDGWAAVKVQGRFGYVNPEGRLAFTIELDELGGSFTDGLALVKQGGRFGYIDQTGHWIFQPILEEARYPSGALAAAKMQGKWGFLDRAGKWVVAPRFDSVGQFDDGEREAFAESNGIDGWVDRKGQFRVETGNAQGPERRMPFNEYGWAAAEKNGRWGLLDADGKWRVAPRFDCIDFCRDIPPPPIRVERMRATCMPSTSERGPFLNEQHDRFRPMSQQTG